MQLDLNSRYNQQININSSLGSLLKRFEKELMARLKKEEFNHELALKNNERNSLNVRLTRDEGSHYINIEENL